jgi:hypothetical protein
LARERGGQRGARSSPVVTAVRWRAPENRLAP